MISAFDARRLELSHPLGRALSHEITGREADMDGTAACSACEPRLSRTIRDPIPAHGAYGQRNRIPCQPVGFPPDGLACDRNGHGLRATSDDGVDP